MADPEEGICRPATELSETRPLDIFDDFRHLQSPRNKYQPSQQEKVVRMKMITRALLGAAAVLVFSLITGPNAQAQNRIGIEDRFADVNGVRLHYLIAGKGNAIILLHGYTQISRMWRPLMAELAKTHTVIAPDLRGIGQSSKPIGGYEKKMMAQDIHALAASLGYQRASIQSSCAERSRIRGEGDG
jgi:alpha/beta hydrolase family protein